MPPRSPQPSRVVLPLSDPARTVALCLSRWSDSPDDPLGIQIDHTLLDRLDWRPGDRITFEPIDLDRDTQQGGLVIRRAIADKPSLKLRRAHYERRKHPYTELFPGCPIPDGLQFGPDGPVVEWPFPPEWIETFFPLEYIPGPGAPIFNEPSRTWLLRDLLDQRDQVVVSIDCSYLEFRLQRTDPNVPTLDVHLPAGVLHLMDWSPSTPLALTSGSGFDPSAPEDLLTIRRSLPSECNLAWDGAKFIATPGPKWLDRYFPGLHDNAEELPPRGPTPIPTNPEGDPDDWDFLGFPGQPPCEQADFFGDEERDTFCVHYSGFRLGLDSLSFAIPERSDVWG
jgi:hypothetical protein